MTQTATETAIPAPAKPTTDWAGEARGIFWLVLAVLGFHSFIAKPFYIPSESMMPGLLVGDRLVVSKFPYGWSFVSPSFHVLPFMQGRVAGNLPERGDIAIVTPTGRSDDYIKRIIGLPGDRIAVREGTVIINGVPVRRTAPVLRRIATDYNQPCTDPIYAPYQTLGADGRIVCELPVVRETLPNGRSYDTIDLGYFGAVDDYPAITIPAGHVFMMGDNRDNSGDSRVPLDRNGLGGAIPWENLGGRAEFVTFSFDGSGSWWNPLSWLTALRGGRAGTSLHPARE